MTQSAVRSGQEENAVQFFPIGNHCSALSRDYAFQFSPPLPQCSRANRRKLAVGYLPFRIAPGRWSGFPRRRLSARRLMVAQQTTAAERLNRKRVFNRSSAHVCTECVIGVTEIASRRCFSVPGLSLAQVSLVSKRNTLRDLVLLLPFGIAGLATIFLSIADRLRPGTDQLAQLSFVFAKPWAWLLDFGAVPGLSHSTRGLGLYVLLLWIPAALYSAALWVVFRTVRYATSAHARMRHFIPHKAPR